ncbi:MAG TPA: hypothetical protein VGZ29_05605 [Terriglobia bacterium]|nr:hypothetical protein [Terriglobia bacterium]
MKALAFWAACATVLFALLLVVLAAGVHRRNWCFAAWLGSGVAVQLGAACLLALGWQRALRYLGQADEWIAVGLALGAMVEAVIRCQRSGVRDEVNLTVAIGLGAILAVNAVQTLAARQGFIATSELWTWFRNIGFMGPAVWMLLSFSNIDFGRALRVARELMASPKLAEALGFARSLVG